MKDHPAPKKTLWEIVALAAIVSWGFWERWQRIGNGPTSDEVSLLKWRGWGWELSDNLNRLHPPLYRMSFTAWLDPAEALDAARLVSVVAGTLTIVLVWLLARRVTHSRLLGLGAALGIAALSYHILFSAMFRPYALLLMLMSAHLVSLTQWLRPERPRWAPWAVALTATVMPQVHYLGLPWLGLTALCTALLIHRSWRVLPLYLGAPLAILPVIGKISGNIVQSSPGPADWQRLGEFLFGMGVRAGPSHVILTNLWPLGLLALVLAVLRWRRLNTSGRLTVAATVSMLMTLAWVVGHHRLTTSTTLLIAPMIWVLVAALPQAIPGSGRISTGLRWIVTGVLIWHIGSMATDRLEYLRNNPTPSERTAQFIEEAHDRFPEDHAIRFASSAHFTVARYLLAGRVLPILHPDERCPHNRCEDINGRLWMVDTNEGWDGPSVLVLGWSKGPYSLPNGCTQAPDPDAVPAFALCASSSP